MHVIIEKDKDGKIDPMYFYKTIYKNKIVFILDTDFIDDNIVDKIIIAMEKNKKAGLDLKKVKKINSTKFISHLLENKFKLFNLNSEVLTYLSLTLKDGCLKSYMNFEDFNQNKRELVRRRFLVA